MFELFESMLRAKSYVATVASGYQHFCSPASLELLSQAPALSCQA